MNRTGGRIERLSWADTVREAVQLQVRLCQKFPKKHPVTVCGIPRGGTCVAMLLCLTSGGKLVMAEQGAFVDVIVDDIVDSGATMRRYINQTHNACHFDALFRKKSAPHFTPKATVVDDNTWLVFPWENESGPEDAVVRLLQYVGEDPRREGLLGTPKRVLRAWAEMCAGYSQDPALILSKQFSENSDQMIMLRGIQFHSLCEHHLLPFSGTVDVAYLPAKGKVVGLSKLARLVECYARRLQVQERMTSQIAEALMKHLKANGAAVLVKARHSCMACRGVKQPGAEMVTSAQLGAFRTEHMARAEFFGLSR